MQSLIRDVRVGARSLLRAPGFTAVVVATLALGIGANTSIYSVVHAVILTPLDFAEPDRLMALWEQYRDDSGRLTKSRVPAANFADWREQSETFEGLAMFGSAAYNWTGSGEPEPLKGARVTTNYFEVVGVEPQRGRFFSEEESRVGFSRVIVLGDGLWRRRFGAADVVGEILTLDGAPYEIVGVAPPGVYPTWPQNSGRMPLLPSYQQFFVPLALTDERWADRRSHVFGVIGRLGAGTSLESARAEMETVAGRLMEAYPRANEDTHILVQPYMREIYGGTREALYLILGAVGVVLLIACANMAGLFLARSQSRRQDAALRMALGASRFAIVRQVLTETLLVSTTAGLLGIGLAAAGVHALVRLSPEEIPRLAEATLEPAALGFALATSLLASLLVGLAPALSVSRTRRADSTRVTGRGRLGSALVVTEVALAVVLVTSAGLLVQSFVQLRQVDLGFRADNVLVADIGLPSSRYDDVGSISRFHQQLVERVSRLPSVRSVSLAYDHPLDSNWGDSFRVVGDTESEESLVATLRIVTPDYFRTVGLDILQGRPFTALDDPAHPGAVIVNEAFAATYLGSRDVIGAAIETSTPHAFDDSLPERFEIVGIVGNVKFLGPEADDEPAFYLPSLQFPLGEMALLVGTDQAPIALAGRIREEIWALDPDLPIGNVNSLARLTDETVAAPRFNTQLFALFGGSALLLAALGIYGLLSYDVTQRTNEIGLRLALGAPARNVVGLVIGQSARLTALGVGIGLVGTWATSRVLSGLLFGVSENDPATLAVVAAVLGGVALLAAYLPARRASRIAPVRALRYE